jgi:hypothetical protein
MLGFGDSSLDFELLVWTRDPRDKNRLASDLKFRIVERLRSHGIEIPFPQRDLHLRSPGLERAARAWARRVAPELDDEAPALAPTLSPAHLAADEHASHDGERAPRDWSDVEVAASARELAVSGEVDIRDRRHLLRLYPDAFVGREAVDWLVAHFGLTRAEAVELGERWVAQGLARHVLDEHGFRDGHFYYVLRS